MVSLEYGSVAHQPILLQLLNYFSLLPATMATAVIPTNEAVTDFIGHLALTIIMSTVSASAAAISVWVAANERVADLSVASKNNKS